jgi:MFS family permease
MEYKERLWTPSFLVLWQSQLVSMLGDAVYAIALGFWILKVTGSTVLMGTLMAVSTLPGILVSPFAGVLIDRANKKALMIAMDIIRGVFVTLLAVSAYAGIIQIWMVFAAGILLIREAGGRVTDYAGNEDCVFSEEIVAANPRLHREMVAYLSSRHRASSQ